MLTFSDDGRRCLLFVVVTIRLTPVLCSESGRYEAIVSVRSVMVEVDGRDTDKVGGSDRPGNVESRKFTAYEAMMIKCILCSVQTYQE